MARREERAWRDYVSEEQRSQPRGPQRGTRVGVEEGCIGGQNGALFPDPPLLPCLYECRTSAVRALSVVTGASALHTVLMTGDAHATSAFRFHVNPCRQGRASEQPPFTGARRNSN